MISLFQVLEYLKFCVPLLDDIKTGYLLKENIVEEVE